MSDEPSPIEIPSSQPHIYRPIPRRNFERFPDISPQPSPTPPRGPSDFAAQLTAKLLRSRNGSNVSDGNQDGVPSRNKSFLNMNSSALFGIYSDIGTGGERSEAATPWGTGAETPARRSMDAGSQWEGITNSPEGIRVEGLRRSTSGREDSARSKSKSRQRQGFTGFVLLAARIFALFLFGVIYGVMVSHLHDSRSLAPLRIQGVDQGQWTYLAGWGVAGVILGSLLPYIDLLWDGDHEQEEAQSANKRRAQKSPLGDQWNPVVRSVGAFVGIAFAIRKLPWQSTLQLSATLALVNPALWYILDRSKTGFTVSGLVSMICTSIFLFAKPDVVPSPALPATNATRVPRSSRFNSGERGPSSVPDSFAGIVSYESLGVATWIGSVLFCSCICFGNIGRKLAILDDSSRNR